MHSGFTALRSACPMNLAHQWKGFTPSKAVLADLARIEELWTMAKGRFGHNSPWLFGDYSLADVFYAPVAARIAGYDLPVSDAGQTYVAAHLSEPCFREWRREGQKVQIEPDPYAMPLDKAPWPEMTV